MNSIILKVDLNKLERVKDQGHCLCGLQTCPCPLFPYTCRCGVFEYIEIPKMLYPTAWGEGTEFLLD